jgi:hypothetical protein
MKLAFFGVFFIALSGLAASGCSSVQEVQLHQFRDLFLYLFQNTGYFPPHIGDCSHRWGNDLYSDAGSQDPHVAKVVIGHNLPIGQAALKTTPGTLVVSINDPALVDNPFGSGWNGYFSDVDIDNLLRSLLNAEGRKKDIVFMNYVRGVNTGQVVHLVSFYFENETKKRYFLVITRPDSMAFVITDSIDWVATLGTLSYSKAAFSSNSLSSNRAGITFGFDKCLISLRLYPEQPVENLVSCAATAYDLQGSLWKVQGKSLKNDQEFISLFTFFVNEYDRQRVSFSLDLFNLLVMSRFRWMPPILFNKTVIAQRLSWEACHLFNPRTYDGVRKLTPKETELLQKMYGVLEPKCIRLAKK